MTVTAAERRMLLALAATVGLALALKMAPPALVAVASLRGRVESERRLVHEVEAAITALPAFEDSAKVLRAAIVSLAPRLLAGETEAAALADLSGRLSLLASQHHGQLLRLDGQQDTVAAGRLRRVRGRAVLETDFLGVAELLAALERQLVMLVPEAISLRPLEAGAGPEAPERLQVELDVVGWYLPGEGR